MRIARYSLDGFVPKRQTYHMNQIWYELYHFNSHELPWHLRDGAVERHAKIVPFLTEHLTDFMHGIWVFIDGNENSMSLNHSKIDLPKWTADIDDNTMVYDVNWERCIPINDHIPKIFGCFIPKRSVILENIKCHGIVVPYSLAAYR